MTLAWPSTRLVPGLEILEAACLGGVSEGGCGASEAQGSLSSPTVPSSLHLHTPRKAPPRPTHCALPPRTRQLRCGTVHTPSLKWKPAAHRPGWAPGETPHHHHHHITTAWGLGSFCRCGRQAATSESKNSISSGPGPREVSPLCILFTPSGS